MLHIWLLPLAFGPPVRDFDRAPADTTDTTGTTDTRDAGVYGGAPTGDDPSFHSVVHVLAGANACTGVAVAPHLVLTAAHCLQTPHSPSEVAIRFGPEPFAAGAVTTTARAYLPHPDYCDECEEDIHDIAWIETVDEIVGVEFPGIIDTQRDYRALMGPGERVTVVGFGESDDGQSSAAYPIRYSAELEVQRLTDSGAEFFAGGDGVDSCRGDSGGPALVADPDGGWSLVGITSRGTMECGGGGYYTAPLPELCWVRETSGISIVPEGCGACDCVDLGRTGCACSGDTSRGSGSRWVWLGLVGVFGAGRRRRHRRDR